MSIPTTEPETFTAGDTVKWTKALADYTPDDGWTLSYSFVSGSDSQAPTNVADNGDGSFLVTISTTDSAEFSAGIYYWQAYVSKSGERYKVDEGRVDVKPDFASQSTGYDARSHVVKVLDALKATIENKASKDQLAYTIAGRSISRLSPGELIKWKNHYEMLYRQEQQAERLANGDALQNTIKVRF